MDGRKNSLSAEVSRGADAIAGAIIDRVGQRIVLGLPLGLGKACHIANALYARAAADPSIRLTIFTALTLEKPHFSSDLERRFLGPLVERLMGGYPRLAYAEALRSGKLPANIEVNEFFFLAGRWLGVAKAQQDYISANYAEASRVLVERGVNVVAQLVAKRGDGDGARYSLSCNTDITLDLLAMRRAGKADFLLTGQVNSELPFMPGDGVLSPDAFTHILDDAASDFPLYAAPNEPIGLSAYAIGFNIAALVPDGGTLQIGIGKEGDATAQALILRQRENAAFKEVLHSLSPEATRPHTGVFTAGLHGVSEMFVSSFLDLIDAGVLKREADGALLYGGFFVGPKSFYERLRAMDEAALSRLRMSAISFTNELYGDEAAKRAARVGARFVNNTMLATLLGSAVSDGLENGRVVSGVGGQYNFVAQAFALEGAQSIIAFKSTRTRGGRTRSNVVWSYAHDTIPRHLRDVFVTEYGVASLRGKTDAECIAGMLAIADSRFQDALLRQAKDAEKIPRSYEIPASQRSNTPERIARALSPLKARGLLPPFPFGSDFNETEQRLLPAMELLGTASSGELAGYALAGLGASADPVLLCRLDLSKPRGFAERIMRLIVRGALAKAGSAS